MTCFAVFAFAYFISTSPENGCVCMMVPAHNDGDDMIANNIATNQTAYLLLFTFNSPSLLKGPISCRLDQAPLV